MFKGVVGINLQENSNVPCRHKNPFSIGTKTSFGNSEAYANISGVAELERRKATQSNGIMPSKQSSSTSKDLIHFGPREVFKHSDIAKERLKRPQRETTTRALVLRNGKYGARGTGEVMLARRMTGREKLDLLAGTVVPLPIHQNLICFIKRILSKSPTRQSCVPFDLRNV